MKKLCIASVVMLSLVVFACNKKDKDNNDNTPVPEEQGSTPKELIIGRWQMVKDSIHSNYFGKDTTIQYPYRTTDTLIFATNGKVYDYEPEDNYLDSSTYSFIGDSTIVMWEDTFSVRSVSTHNLLLYNYWKPANSTLFEETYSILKK
jgi:hypothetical protein